MALVRGRVACVTITASLLFSSLALLAAPAAATPPEPLTIYPLEPITGLEYVAIAPRSFADSLAPLISWKNQKGVPAQVFVLEDALAPPTTGRDAGEKLHNFLHDLYLRAGQSPKWLLLVGDGDWDNPIIPLREVFTNSQHDGDVTNSQNWYTTDTYYGNLDSSWDEDRDGTFGELNEGDWTPELYVGRVPADNPAQVQQWVARQVMYETAPPQGPWSRRAVLAGALMDKPNLLDNPFTAVDEGFDPFTDNARKVNEEVAAQAPSNLEIDRLYDYPIFEGGQYTTATDNLQVGALKTAIDAGAALVLLEGHGYTSNRGVAQYDDPTGTKSIFRSDAEEPALRYDEVLNLTNGDQLPFVYVSACYSGDFTDRDDTDFEAFLKAPLGGAIAVVAGNGENYRLENLSGQQGYGNWWLAKEFFHMLFVEGYSQPGKVLGDLKQRYHDYFTAQGPTDSFSQNYFRAERVSYNLMGDPEFSVITDTPVPLGAAPVRQPFLGETSVQIQVSGRGGALAGALVHLWGPRGDVRARTNASGVATLPYDFSDLSAYNLTVTAPNHLPLTTSFAPAVPDHNLAFEHPWLWAPSIVRRGDPITVTGTVVARGIVPYRDVVVEYRTGSPSTGPIVAAVAVGQVSPGLPQPVLATMSFDTSGKFLVYATIDPGSEQVEDTRADNVAFATIEVNYPPQFAPLPTLSVPAGRALPDALNLPSYVTDRDHAVIALSFRVASVSDPRVDAFVAGQTMGIKASPDAPPSVTVTLEASDGLESTTANVSVVVTREDRPPTLDPVMEAEAFVGEPFALQLHAADPEGAPLLWSDDSTLFDIDPTGRIAFTPAASEVGRFAVTVTVSDGRASSSHTFLLVVAQRTQGTEVHNLPILRASAGHPIVLDLNLISSDAGTTFVTDRQDVSIDASARTLRFTPAAGEPRLETIRLIVAKEGGTQTIVVVTVDVAAAPAPSGDVFLFAGVGLGLAAVVGLTLMRSHQVRLRDERIFKIAGKPPKAAQKPKGAKDAAGGGKDPPPAKRGSKEDE